MQIRAEQMQALHQYTLAAFENEMVAHSRKFSPRLCEVLGEEQLRFFIRTAMQRADGYGFTCRGPVRLFIEVSFLFGSGFDTDPQYPWAADLLRGADHQMFRADQLHQKADEYLDKVSGPKNVNTRAALAQLAAAASETVPAMMTQSFSSALLNEMRRIFPQKVDYVGEESLQALIQEGRGIAEKYGFTWIRAEGLIVVLMFAFGHGCTDDPLYPWISRTLNDPLIMDAPGRADRLEKKAVTWLSHVLEQTSGGAPL